MANRTAALEERRREPAPHEHGLCDGCYERSKLLADYAVALATVEADQDATMASYTCARDQFETASAEFATLRARAADVEGIAEVLDIFYLMQKDANRMPTWREVAAVVSAWLLMAEKEK